MRNALAGHTNSFHTYGREEALAGIAEAGYRTVELTAVEGWTEHVDLDADTGELRARLEHYGLEPVVLSGHSDLTTDEGLAYGIKAVEWCANYGLPVMNTAIGGHASQEENESAFLANIEALANAAEDAGVDVALEIHGDIMASGARTLPLLERIGHPRIKVAYDTGNCEFYGDVKAVDDLAGDRPVPRQRAPQGSPRRQGRLGLPGAGRRHDRLRRRCSASSRPAATAARSRWRSSSRAIRGRRSPRSTRRWRAPARI